MNDKLEPDGARAFVPCLRLFAAPVLVSTRAGLGSDCDELTLPLIALSFDYGGTRIRAADPRDRLVCSDGNRLVPRERDCGGEAAARRELERRGAVELACCEELTALPGCDADYVVRLDADHHARCAFTAEAVPALRARGWQVRIDDDYPFRVLADEAPWFASVAPDEELPGWFSFELGVEVEGKRIDLLPLVLALLDDADGKDLRALEQRFRNVWALPVDESRHVMVPSERLARLVRVIVELYQGGARRAASPRLGTSSPPRSALFGARSPGRLAFPEVRAGALAGLDAELRHKGTPLTWHDPAGVVERARAVTARPVRVAEPARLRASLRPYQEEGVAFLQHLRRTAMGGILADDMGLGKTLQTIAHLCLEREAGRLDPPALVVAPKSLVGNWLRELHKFAPHLRVMPLVGAARRTRFHAVPRQDVVVTSYPSLVRDEERLANLNFSTLILDEAQSIKNERSQTHRAIKSLTAEQRVCLTGTPIENNLGELWAIFDFLNPGLLGDALGFRRWYRQPIEQERSQERLEALREQIAPFMLRRLKRDVARDLPPKTELLTPVELRGRQRELYEHIRVAAHADVRAAIRHKGLAAATIPILDALMKLRQVCCDPRLVAMDEARTTPIESAKHEALLSLLETQLGGGHRVLVFSQFTSMLALISDGLRERGRPHLILTGATRDRQAVVDAFERGRADVFLISLKAGGTGLNLTSADTVIHYDPWWNPAAQAQASDRAYRIGQARPVFVHNLYVAGSVEERVLRLQQHKRWLSTTLLGDVAPSGTQLSSDEVESLFAPLDNTDD
jgi:superfamily II DNA or RNA helicase